MKSAIASLLSKAALLMIPAYRLETPQAMAVTAAQTAADARGIKLNAAQAMMLSWGVIPFTVTGGYRNQSYTKRGPGRKAHKSAR